MRRQVVWMFSCLVWVGGATAALVCDEPVYDFGEADESATLNHVFSLRNDGDRPIRILKVQATCGCTTAGAAREDLPPGETTDLTTRISLRGRSGPQKYSLTIHTDPPQKPVLRLGIKGAVVRDLRLDPQRLEFTWPTPEDALSARVSVVSGGATEFSITGTRVSDASLTAALETVRAGLEYHLLVQIDPQRIQPPFRGYVIVETDHPRHPRFHVPVNVLPGGNIVVRPTALRLANQPADVPQRRKLIVYSRDGTPFTIETIRFPDGVRGTVRTISPHRHDVDIDGLLPRPALRQQAVTITTSLGALIEVPFEIIE